MFCRRHRRSGRAAAQQPRVAESVLNHLRFAGPEKQHLIRTAMNSAATLGMELPLDEDWSSGREGSPRTPKARDTFEASGPKVLECGWPREEDKLRG